MISPADVTTDEGGLMDFVRLKPLLECHVWMMIHTD